jgi:hypothetical protein
MLKEANTQIKNSMIRLQHLTGDTSYINPIKLGQTASFPIPADVPLICKVLLPKIDVSNQDYQLVFRFKYA